MQRFLLLLFISLVACTSKQTPESVAYSCLSKTCIGPTAMVVTAHTEATQVGVAVLQKGGNAVDAMVAVQFALAVVYPNAGNIGGGGFMVYRNQTGEAYTLDFREKAPLKASKNMYLDDNGTVVPDLSTAGYLAAGVPGTVDGMVQAHKKFGKLAWEDLLAPAVALAENGFKITQRQADEFNSNKNNFLQHNKDANQVALIKNEEWKRDHVLIQPQLAATLKRIQQQGRAGFYAGETARLIAEDMGANGGLISLEDLDQYKSVWREPLQGKFGQYNIISMGPPSSGGIALLQLLNMSQYFPLKEWGFHNTPTVHAIAEMERRVYLDRTEHLGDPDFWTVPVKQLLDTAYLRRKAGSISKANATPSRSLAPAKDLAAPVKEHEETTHFSIVDAQGNAVAVTTTINGSYGALTFVKGAGFLLNNEMDDFSIKPGEPNMYGLVGGEANAIAPGKRMLSSMTPTIVEKNGKLHMVVGTPGGSTIITSVYQTILNTIVFDMSMEEAVHAGRFHHQWLPDILYFEANSLPREVQDSLRMRGHTLERRSPIGRVDAILKMQNGNLEGAADPRGDDVAGGY